MEFTKQDLLQAENLIKAINKGSFTLEGVEVLAMAQAMKWLGQLQAVIKMSLEPPQVAQPKEVKDPITPPVPVQATSKPKASKKGT